MAKKKKKGRKGTFGDAREPRRDRRLSLAKAYVMPPSRRALVLVGLAGVALFVAWTVIDFMKLDAGFLSNGPLASSHATLDDDCTACHAPLDAVTSEKCSVCHEKLGDKLGVYTYDAHYLYRSNDFNRLVSSPEETSCAACHPEHGGREATLTHVADQRCRTCHEWKSFNDGHPQFAAHVSSQDTASQDTATQGEAGIADDAGITFPHVQHVREIRRREGVEDVERTCLYCHQPTEDGRGFEPLDFDRHCDACHLTAGARTLPVPLVEGDYPGVVTLAEIQGERAPGTDWAYFMSPLEFRVRGGQVVKSPIYHRDPWILENLRRLRRQLYDDAGIADLLQTSVEGPVDERANLYREAIDTLSVYARGLRSRPEPEVQSDLQKIERALDELSRALEDPYTPLDETRFLLALETPRDLPDAEVDEIYEVMGALVDVCLQCHYVDQATIVRVQKDQRTYHRAEFNHRAHVIEVRCLECHTEIPIQELLPPDVPPDPDRDNADLLNLPRIERCRECHRPDKVSNRCTTCHLFHPDKSRRSNLLLYVERAPINEVDDASETP